MSAIEIRELHDMAEFAQLYRVFDSIWHPEPGNPPVTVELMKVFSHSGSYVAGAFEGGEMVGGSVGLLAAGGSLHSHVTGAAIGRGIGLALKYHQRDWALARGLTTITWTFDPLVRRNARFNLVKLGAMPEEYLEGFYGEMADAINEGDESDRLLAVWRLTGEREPYSLDGAVTGLAERDGLPHALPLDGAPGGAPDRAVGGATVLVATPPDIETLRRGDPGAGKAWRMAVRDVLGGLMRDGGSVVGFTDRGEYVVDLKQA
ncbi:GNAT family N-acetyltransferase [Nonomuraea sp. NBC_01738]|uniref:GNAT family N-acetyltransferase n=1 Tax=Nonomuraea sp. NBC_01738 TaxID=2976003 RepID=UPI002E150DD7|nr:GNAT family N-acetyltransferase [Nonomuraea sp. NBC_01738]